MTTISDTKSQIMDLAENLLLQRGYNGFSYTHISSALQVKNAAIHYHFPTKTDLGVAIIQRARQQFQKWTIHPRMDGFSFPKKLEAFFDIFRDFLKFNGHICLGSALEHDFNTLPETMQEETRAFIADFLIWLEKLFREGREQGDFSFSGSPKEQAVFVLAALQGATQMVRATNMSYLDMAIRRIKKTLKQ
jgi:TetR/AcrR family transcriptional regulator, transcriptional repressor for nem operon